MLVCGGDGLADIVGRRWGTLKLPWSRDKSWIGSLGFFVGAWLLTVFVLAVFVAAGVFAQPLSLWILPVTLIALAATAVESFSPPDTDNLTIPLTAVILGHLLFA
jgi:dolichol kinase